MPTEELTKANHKNNQVPEHLDKEKTFCPEGRYLGTAGNTVTRCLFPPFEMGKKTPTPPINKHAHPAARKKQKDVYRSEKLKNSSKNSREFAKLMIIDRIMSLETIARLSGLDIKAVQVLATIITWKTDKGT